MNIFSKFLLVILGLAIFIGGVTQLQLIAFELMNESDTSSFFLGVFYLAIVIFIWASSIYVAVDYLRKLVAKKDPVDVEQTKDSVEAEQ
jgi:TRAP-type C4-dicarboxylate transport system permease small subunit